MNTKTKLVRIIGMIVLTAFGTSLQAGEWFANCKAVDDSGDGLTPETAKKYIQSAINLSEASDDTERIVTVFPGDYDDGAADISTDGLPARVTITKPITLRSAKGKDVTHIVGHYGTPTDADTAAFALANLGPGAVRGIYVGGSAASGTVIEGFTIRNCATLYDLSNGWAAKGTGGGLFVNYVYKVYVCDCVIRDCYAALAGASHYGTAARCWFIGNSSGYRDGSIGVIGYTKLANSILIRNKGKGGYVAGYNPTIVNCTMYGNPGPWGNGGTSNPTTFYNCLSIGNLYYGPYSGKEVYAYNSVFSVAESSDYLNLKGGEGNRFSAGGATKNFFASALDDYRLVPSSLAVAAGSFSVLDEQTTAMGIPERHRFKDCLGNEIVADANGKINCGAVQEVFNEDEVASGVLQLSIEVGAAGIGCAENNNQWTTPGETVYQSVRSTKWPAQVRIDHFSHGSRLLYFKDGSGYRYFGNLTNDECWVTLPPKGVTNCISAQLASCVIYADASKDGDTGDGLKPETAKKTIQAAVDAARTVGDYGLVLVAPGEYRDGVTNTTTTGKSRVLISGKSAMVRSTAGAERTFIIGEPDPGTAGIGPNAVRCVATECTGWIQGFTLTGGWTKNDSSIGYGAGFFGGGASETRGRALVDCIVTNNHARNCAAIYQGQADRCFFADNHNAVATMDSYAVFRGNLMTSCVIRRQPNDLGLLFRESTLHNCTVIGGDGSKSMSYDGKLKSYNSILLGCGALASLESGYVMSGCVLFGTTIPGSAPQYRTFNPALADPEQPDMRPYRGSGILDAGDSLSKTDASRWRLCGGDIFGDPIVIEQGKVVPGAVQEFHDAAVRISNLSDKVAVTGGATEGWNSLAYGQDYKLMAVDTHRPFVGFIVDGAPIVPRSYELTVDGDFVGKEVEVGYTSDWYVNDASGSDTADGMTPKTARKTLAGAMTPDVLSGDTVHVAPGVYDDEEMTYESQTLASRVVVPDGVTLIADEGPAVTRIVGAPAEGKEAGISGLGTGAVRGVVLGPYARIEGFTITGGHTLSADQTTATAAEGQGGGIWFARTAADTVAYGCVITGNNALAGGGVFKGYCVNCTFTDNDAVRYGAMLDQGFAYGCVFDGNQSYATVMNGYREVYGCTFGPGLLNGDGKVKTTLGSPNDADESHAWCSKFANNVVMVPHEVGANHVHIYNSVLLDGGAIDKTRCAGCAFPATLEAFCVDGTGAPIAGSASPALGLADPSKVSGLLDGKDVVGNPRMSNGTIDAGAFQSDWRARYLADLKASRRKLSCTFASTNVHEIVGTQAVRLENGEIVLSRRIAVEESEPMTLRAAIDEGATGRLLVYIDGVCVKEYMASVREVSDTLPLPPDAGTEIRFVYEKGVGDLGSAEILLCGLPKPGLVFMVR